MKRGVMFVVWPNGFQYVSEILDTLAEANTFKILRLIKRPSTNITQIINSVYKNDQVEALHIRGKVNYLKNQKGYVLYILCEETAPHLILTGRNKNIIESQNVAIVKNYIREKFNLRDRNGLITHNHVIHSTDSEDDALRLWSTIEPLYVDNFPFAKLGSWGVDKNSVGRGQETLRSQLTSTIVSVDALLASMPRKNGQPLETMSLTQTPHFKFLDGDARAYTDFIDEHRGLAHKSFYSPKRFEGLLQSAQADFTKIKPIMVRQIGQQFVILDGLHRASIVKFLGYDSIRTQVYNE